MMVQLNHCLYIQVLIHLLLIIVGSCEFFVLDESAFHIKMTAVAESKQCFFFSYFISDQRYAKTDVDVENALVQKIKSVWDALPCPSQGSDKDGLSSEPDFYKKYYSTNGFVSTHTKQDIYEEIDAANENEHEHISNGYGSFQIDTNILASGDGVHNGEIDTGNLSANVWGSPELDIISLANDNGVYYQNGETVLNPSVTQGKNTQDGGKREASPVFDCALRALVWATQGKDPAVVSCMKAPKELIPAAPSSLAEADHIQVLVTGSSKIVGSVLSVLLPNMND